MTQEESPTARAALNLDTPASGSAGGRRSLGSLSALVAAVPALLLWTGDAQGATPEHRHTVYINFQGGKLSLGSNPNAAEMETLCAPKSVDVPAWPGTEKEAAAVVKIVQEAFAPFGVRIVYEERPPQHLPYSQVMVGGYFGSNAAATCSSDCGDLAWRETGFVWPEPSEFETFSVQKTANSIVYVIAQHAGLDGTADSALYTNGLSSMAERTWSSGCVALNTFACSSKHDVFCGEGSKMQDDVAELLATYGANSPDDVPPTVKLLSPLSGSVFEPGQVVKIQTEVDDNFGGVGWRLMLLEAGLVSPAYAQETMWELKLPPGVHTIRVEAIDHDRNVAFAESKISVVEPPPEGDSDDAPTTGVDVPTTGDDNPAMGDSSSSGGVDSAGGDDSSKPGCDCSARAEPRTTRFGLLSLAGLNLLRRRRR